MSAIEKMQQAEQFEAEQTEIKQADEAAPRTATHRVIEHRFHWLSADPDVGEVVIPLKFKGKLLKAVRDMQDDEIGLIFYMLDALGVPESTTDEMDALEIKDMFLAWQKAWQAQSGADLGEALRSSS